MEATDPRRNMPTEKGRNNDPNLRDESAIQPGINTISNSDYDKPTKNLLKLLRMISEKMIRLSQHQILPSTK